MPLAARALPAALAVVILAGCGDEREEPPATALGEPRAGSVATLAQCRDWRTGSRAQQLATIGDVRRAINLRDTETPVPALSDKEATAVFDQACAPSYAAGFRLYKLYSRAAAFHTLPAPGPG